MLELLEMDDSKDEKSPVWRKFISLDGGAESWILENRMYAVGLQRASNIH
jgi:hypothetical protein